MAAISKAWQWHRMERCPIFVHRPALTWLPVGPVSVPLSHERQANSSVVDWDTQLKRNGMDLFFFFLNTRYYSREMLTFSCLKKRIKDTAPHCGGWHNPHQMTTGVNQHNELPDFETHPCTPSSGERNSSSDVTVKKLGPKPSFPPEPNLYDLHQTMYSKWAHQRRVEGQECGLGLGP